MKKRSVIPQRRPNYSFTQERAAVAMQTHVDCEEIQNQVNRASPSHHYSPLLCTFMLASRLASQMAGTYSLLRVDFFVGFLAFFVGGWSSSSFSSSGSKLAYRPFGTTIEKNTPSSAKADSSILALRFLAGVGSGCCYCGLEPRLAPAFCCPFRLLCLVGCRSGCCSSSSESSWS